MSVLPKNRMLMVALCGLPLLMAVDDCAPTGEWCPQEPMESYSALEAGDGEACNYDVDCYSGMCIPTGEGTAECAAGLGTTSACIGTHGDGWVSAVSNRCDGGDPQEYCRPSTEDCDTSGILDVGEACACSDACASGYCLIDVGEELGECGDYCERSCPADMQCSQLGNPDPDPTYLCVPSDW